ncbi:flagellar hook-length control protein FliK [Roseateles sp. LKC17W]|uniref:Flagellar hook-length control protein FliK n=1 Tax=Pelomonas margarita TaxID=3299031 RepID=A0ABW7FH40_9BURK
MITTAQTLPPKPAAPPAAAPAPATQPAAAGMPSFAQFLTVQSALPEAAPDAATASESSAESAPETDRTAPAAATRRTTQHARPATPGRAAEPAKAEARAEASTDPATTDTVATEDEPLPDTPELNEFTQLLGLAAQPAEALPRTATPRGRVAAGADDDTASRSTARGAAIGSDTRTPPGAEPADARSNPRAALARPDTTTDTPLPATSTTAAPLGAEAAAATPPTAGAPTTGFAAMLAQALPWPALAAEVAAAPVQSGVQAHLQGAAFAPELGARVSMLAVDGVQRAELQLNPAEMGPVSVQITVDGSQAQVSFHAAQAQTRAALEQSLPELAAALQGQGLTLSGGGVFQRSSGDGPAGQARGESGEAGRTRGTGSGGSAGEPAPTAAPARRTTGLLDTFA